MKKLIILSIIFVQLSCNQSDPIVYDFVIENVNLFNGHENLGVVNLAIHGDSIANISKERLKGDSIIDGKGKFIVPGLVNGHTHAWTLDQLKESYEAGVITMVNLHQVNESIDSDFRNYRDSLGYANFYSAGIAATVPNGHPTQYGTIETINDTFSEEQFVLNRIRKGADLIKIICDSTAYPPKFNVSPTLNYTQIENIINEAHKNEKKAVVHIQHLKDLLNISRFKPDGFIHMWFFKVTISDNDINVIKNSGAFIMPTALTQLKSIEYAKNDTTAYKDWALSNFTSMYTIKIEIAKLHEADIPLLAGTDSPNLGINYGDDLLNELFILHEAGLSNIVVLQTATGNASKHLDIDGNGLISVGGKATFLVLNSNPIEDLNALRNIYSIWKNGETN